MERHKPQFIVTNDNQAHATRVGAVMGTLRKNPDILIHLGKNVLIDVGGGATVGGVFDNPQEMPLAVSIILGILWFTFIANIAKLYKGSKEDSKKAKAEPGETLLFNRSGSITKAWKERKVQFPYTETFVKEVTPPQNSQ